MAPLLKEPSSQDTEEAVILADCKPHNGEHNVLRELSITSKKLRDKVFSKKNISSDRSPFRSRHRDRSPSGTSVVKHRNRDPSPSGSSVVKHRNRDPSPSVSSSVSYRNRDPSPSVKGRNRDPSPSGSLASKSRNRDPSPSSSVRGRQRDPSPSSSLKNRKNRDPSPSGSRLPGSRLPGISEHGELFSIKENDKSAKKMLANIERKVRFKPKVQFSMDI